MPAPIQRNVEMIPTDFVKVPEKRRRPFPLADETNQHFVDSIKRVGVIHPMKVRKVNDEFYELVIGRRRLAACRHLGMDAVPCEVGEWTEKEMEFLSLVENNQRKHQSAVEQIKQIQAQMKVFEQIFGQDPGRAVGGLARAKSAKRTKNGTFVKPAPQNGQESTPDNANGPASAAPADAGGDSKTDAEGESPSTEKKTFTKLVAEGTGKAERTARHDIALASTFTPEQLDELVESDISKADMLRIAEIEEEEVRDLIVKYVAAGNLGVDEAIERATASTENAPKVAQEAIALAKKAVKEAEMSDDQWLVTCCAGVRERLQDTYEFDQDALLYRATVVARSEFLRRAKEPVLAALKLGWTPCRGVMRQVMFMLHPAQWLLCLDCAGRNLDHPECPGCRGLGYLYQWDKQRK